MIKIHSLILVVKINKFKILKKSKVILYTFRVLQDTGHENNATIHFTMTWWTRVIVLLSVGFVRLAVTLVKLSQLVCGIPWEVSVKVILESWYCHVVKRLASFRLAVLIPQFWFRCILNTCNLLIKFSNDLFHHL